MAVSPAALACVCEPAVPSRRGVCWGESSTDWVASLGSGPSLPSVPETRASGGCPDRLDSAGFQRGPGPYSRGRWNTGPGHLRKPFRRGNRGRRRPYAVPGLGGKHLYVFDDISVAEGCRPVEAKVHGLMRLMAGIPKESGIAVLFDGGEDRLCFARYCIRTLDSKQRDALIREALEDLQKS